MTYADPSTINGSAGISEYLLYLNEVTYHVFSSLMLMGIFLVFMLGSYYASRRMTSTSEGNMPVSFAVAGFITFILAIVLSGIDDFISLYEILVTLVVAIIGAIALFSQKDRI